MTQHDWTPVVDREHRNEVYTQGTSRFYRTREGADAYERELRATGVTPVRILNMQAITDPSTHAQRYAHVHSKELYTK
jgi:hypothetical protein